MPPGLPAGVWHGAALRFNQGTAGSTPGSGPVMSKESVVSRELERVTSQLGFPLLSGDGGGGVSAFPPL